MTLSSVNGHGDIRAPAIGTTEYAAGHQLRATPGGDSQTNEFAICIASARSRGTEPLENRLDRLPGSRRTTDQRRMPGKREPIELVKIADEPRPQGIQVNVSDELEKIRLVFAENRPEAVLEQVTDALVTAIEDDGMTGE